MAARITVNLGRKKGEEGRKERQGGRGSRRLTNGGATVVREGRGDFRSFPWSPDSIRDMPEPAPAAKDP